jgi:alpha-beta hydrolase superfamily lysophospholipase
MSQIGSGEVAAPFFFPVRGSSCMGWFHPAQGLRQAPGVVMCRAIGFESMCAYGAFTQMSEALALAGFHVLRFDYPGTGDSAGDDAEPERVQHWIDGIEAAAKMLTRITGCERLTLLGLRLGATLALQAATRLASVESLVLWAPCRSGRAFARELRMATTQRASRTQTAPAGDIQSLGFLYTAQTLADLEALPALPPQLAAAGRSTKVLVLDRDDMPQGLQLAQSLGSLGWETRYTVAPGYAQMMAEPRETRLAADSVTLLIDWLKEAAAGAAGRSALAHAMPARPPRELAASQHAWQGVQETAARFGPGPGLFGVLTQPQPAQPHEGREQTAILMLNVGGNYRIGPNRIYTALARSLAQAGYSALRFDLPGIGDSAGLDGFSPRTLYSRDATPPVRAAIDFLVEQGCRHFYLLGICSGSFVAFQTALSDARVTGQVLMNSRLLEWREAQPDGSWQDAMQQAYKSSGFYRRQLLEPAVYRRLLRGDIDVLGISRRMHTLLMARVRRSLKQLLGRSPPTDDVLAKVRGLSMRGTNTLLLVTQDDDGRDYLEFHFGSRGSYLEGDPHFKMVLVENSDHTFSDAPAQAFVTAALKAHLDARHGLQAGRPTKDCLQLVNPEG